MQINSIASSPNPAVQGRDIFAKAKQSFQNLGGALESGNLSDTKEALAQLQKNAPPQAGKQNNPISAKMETLSKALESGDLKAAQEAYADIKKAVSQRPSGGGERAGGPPPGGAPPSDANKSSSAGGSSSSNKVYDKMDTSKDGIVPSQEEYEYYLKHPEQAKETSSTTGTDSNRGSLDALA